MKKFLLTFIAFVSALTLVFAFSGSMFEAKASGFNDALNNNRVHNKTRLELEVKDGQPSSTRAYFSEPVDLTNGFEFYVSIADLCTDGGFRISFLSSSGDYPMESYGDGFGIYFWDETAWGHPDKTYLRADLMSYNKAGEKGQDAKRLFALDEPTYLNKELYVKAWNYDQDNFAIQINTDGTKEASTAPVIGTIAKSKCGAIDLTNCVMMITPEIDGSRAHSYERNVQLDIDVAGTFKDALSNGRVYSKPLLELEVKDGQPSSTRAYFSEPVDLTNGFEFYVSIADLCTDGGFRISFLSSSGDYPMESYGDGFGIYFWDETAWGHPDKTYLRADLMSYNKAGEKGQDAKRLFALDEPTYLNKELYVKAWNYDQDNFAIQINTDGTKEASTAPVIGTIAKSKCGAIDLTNCVMMITPEIDGSRAHSYERNVQLALSMPEYYSVTSGTCEHGTIQLSKTSVMKGQSVTLTVTPEEGYDISSVKVNGTAVELDTNNQYVISNITADTIVTAEFEQKEGTKYTLTVTDSEHGTVEQTASGSIVEGTEVTLTPKPNKGYRVTGVTVNETEAQLTNGKLTVTMTEDMTVAFSYAPYQIEEGSRFSDALNNGNVDAYTVEGGTVLSFLTMQNKTVSRALYESKVSLNSLEFSFVINSFNVDGAIRFSFLSQSSDYPMEKYGEGLCLYFWDETAWGHPELTSLRCDSYAYGYGDNDKTCIKEDRCISNGTIVGTKVTVKYWQFSEDSLAVHIFINDEFATGAEISKALLPSQFNWNDCYMIITPEVDDNREHSWNEDVSITIGEITTTKADVDPVTPVDPVDPVDPVEPTEYSITFKSGDTVLRVAYAEEGEKFTLFDAPAVEGYEFDGWYLDKEFTTVLDDLTAKEDLVVYAKYVQKQTPGTTSEVTPSTSEVTPSSTPSDVKETVKKGCNSSLAISVLTLVFAPAAMAVLVIKRKRH